MKYFILLIALLSLTVQADLPTNPVFSLTHPTIDINGEPITITESQIHCSTTDDPPVSVAPLSIIPPATEYTTTIGEFPDGTYACDSVGVAVGGGVSDPSPFVNFIVQEGVIILIPMPPTNNTVR